MSQLVRDTASVMQEFTQSGGVRPFGLSILVAGYDDNGPQVRASVGLYAGVGLVTTRRVHFSKPWCVTGPHLTDLLVPPSPISPPKT